MVTAVKMNNRMAKKETLPEKQSEGKSGKPVKDPLADHPHLKTTIAQIEKQFGEGSIMPLGSHRRGHDQSARHSDRQPVARFGFGRRWTAQGSHRRDFWPRIERQNHACVARDCPGAACRRHRRIHRCRTCTGSHLGQKTGRQPGNAAGQPARQRRRSDEHHRNADQEQRGRYYRDRLGGGTWCRKRNSMAKWAIRMSACRPV